MHNMDFKKWTYWLYRYAMEGRGLDSLELCIEIQKGLDRVQEFNRDGEVAILKQTNK